MSTSLFIQQLDVIRQKVLRLQRRNQQLEESNQALREKTNALQLQLQESRRMVSELESQKKILKIAKGLQQDPKAKQEAKLKINEFIKEIDKCIALMND
jgi:cell division septum initiation protein DivIVA